MISETELNFPILFIYFYILFATKYIPCTNMKILCNTKQQQQQQQEQQQKRDDDGMKENNDRNVMQLPSTSVNSNNRFQQTLNTEQPEVTAVNNQQSTKLQEIITVQPVPIIVNRSASFDERRRSKFF